MAPRLPDFLILGAGRCGTTSLVASLRNHPELFLSDPKEPSFFSEPFQLTRNPVTYASLFSAAADHQRTGEASHAYLSNPRSAETIKAFLPEARFVVMFRNPADRAIAMYSYMLENGYELLPSFERALAAEERRYTSDRFRRTCPNSFWNFMYYRSGLFGEQMERYLALFPRERFHVTTLYRMIDDPVGEIGAVHRFLGVEPDPPSSLPRDGSSKGVRSIAVQYAERTVVRRLARRVPGFTEIHRSMNRWNRGTPPRMPPELRAALVDRFRPDLERLKELTGCDVLGDEQAHAAHVPAQPSPAPR